MPVSLPVQLPESLPNAVETRLFTLLHNTSVKVRIRNHANVQARPTAMATHISNAVKRLLGKLLPVGIRTKVRLFDTAAAVLLHFHMRLKDKSERLRGKEFSLLSCERAAIQTSTEERISCSDCSYHIMI